MLNYIKGMFAPRRAALPGSTVSALGPAAPTRYRVNDGDKFAGGFGSTDILTADYWTLRARSSQLFETNLYARGLIRRLVTNEINTGLHLEAVPEEALLGMPEDSLADWSETTENRFSIWANRAELCDHVEQRAFGELQAAARAEALVAGDVLCVLVQSPITFLPRLKLINGAAVQTPAHVLGSFGKLANGNRIVHGVEIDPDGRHVAYWIVKQSQSSPFGLPESERLPAFGAKTGRRTAWLLYGTDKRLDDVRGKPLLALVLQSLKEIDRYRDSVQRKAVINAILAMFIEKGEPLPGTRPITGGAIRRNQDTTVDSAGTPRLFNVAEQIPGLVLDELQHGEKPHGFQSNGTDEKFGDFEEAIIQAVAWANEVPPEILRLSFSSNYSASQAAINEFKMYLNLVRTTFGMRFCQPIYVEWMLSELLTQKLEAPGLLEAWRDKTQYDKFGAWTSADWSGHIKPAVDMSKLVKGYDALVAAGFITRDRASRELTGTKYSKNVQKLARENAQLAEANAPMAALENKGPTAAPGANAADALDQTDQEDTA